MRYCACARKSCKDRFWTRCQFCRHFFYLLDTFDGWDDKSAFLEDGTKQGMIRSINGRRITLLTPLIVGDRGCVDTLKVGSSTNEISAGFRYTAVTDVGDGCYLNVMIKLAPDKGALCNM